MSEMHHNDSIPLTLRSVNARVDRLETLILENRASAKVEHAELLRNVTDIKDTIGSPGDEGGAKNATGIFAHLANHENRIRPFEARWLEVKGALKVGAPLLLLFGAIIWFLAGGRITMLLHG